jgi:SAM-dependent methyltransferase
MSHDRPWLIRMLPEPLRRLIRHAINPYFDRAVYQSVTQTAVIDGRHLPIRPLDEAVVVSKAVREDLASPDGMPIPPRNLWWDYADTAERYLEIGRINIRKMREILAPHGADLRPGLRILDFGCAAGPQIRCLRDFAASGEVWGVDISAEHVGWCVQHLPETFRFAVTTTAPHLPFEDRYFDLIYCGSVFSHIGEMTAAWLLELARIIRPGGSLYLTINTKQSMHAYLNRWPQLEFSRRVRELLTDEQIGSDFSYAEVGRGPWLHSIHDIGSFRRMCEAAFDVTAVVRNVYSFQTALLLRRREPTRKHESAALGPAGTPASAT